MQLSYYGTNMTIIESFIKDLLPNCNFLGTSCYLQTLQSFLS